MWLVAVHRYKLKDDVRESLYDVCTQWTSALRKSGHKFMGGDRPNLADLVNHSAAFLVGLFKQMLPFQNFVRF